MNGRMIFQIMAVISLFAGALAHAADKIELCTLCHGTDANGNFGVRAPKLAGLSRDYVVRQLNAFRFGIRGTHPLDVSGSEMRIVALSLKESELAGVVESLSRFKPQAPMTNVQGDPVRGETLYRSCAGCHGSRGEGNSAANAPALASGSDWYWVIQLGNYRRGLRGSNPSDSLGAAMQTAAKTLPDDRAVLDVVAYINTLHD